MGERHVDELFSAAYDGMLRDAERARYDEHVASCAQCAARAEELRAAVDAVHALPAARMPVRVVLPSAPPVAERGRFTLPRLPRLSPVWGAGAMAAVGIAAVAVAVHVHGGGGAASPTGALGAGALHSLPGGAQAAGPGNQLANFCTTPLTVTTAKPGVTSGGSPAGFSNRVTISIPQRPGEELVLATTGSHYAPGSQVLVFAALTTSSGGHKAVVPCVTLRQAGATAFSQYAGDSGAGGGAPAGGNGSASAPQTKSSQSSAAMNGVSAGPVLYPDRAVAVGPPLAIAVPTQQVIAGTLTVQVITIPDTVPRGAQLQLVAVVPSGWPTSADHQPIQAVLTLDVS